MTIKQITNTALSYYILSPCGGLAQWQHCWLYQWSYLTWN